MKRLSPLLLSLILGACAARPPDVGDALVPKTPLRGGIVEFVLSSYDGESLKGRVLLGASIDPLVIDGRLLEWIDLEVRKVRTCDKQEVLSYYHLDIHYPPLRNDEIVTLKPKYWYGADIDLLLFGSQLKQPKPDCFEGELMVWSLDGRLAATRTIRVTRTDKAPAEASKDGNAGDGGNMNEKKEP